MGGKGYKGAMELNDLKKRMFAAMKAGRVVEKEILRTALGELTEMAARSGSEPTPAELERVLRKLVKSNRESLAACQDSSQKATLEEEIGILEELLPRTLDVEAIVSALAPLREQLRAAAGDGQATGVAMKHLRAEGAAVEGKDVASAVRRLREG